MVQSDPSTAYPDNKAQAIVDVLIGFVKVHQALLNTVSSPHLARVGHVLT
jgi:hypothetical protein